EEHQRRRLVPSAAPREGLRPEGLGAVEHRRDEEHHRLLRGVLHRCLDGARCAGPATLHQAEERQRVLLEDDREDDEEDDAADAKPAESAAAEPAGAAAVLEIAAAAGGRETHGPAPGGRTPRYYRAPGPRVRRHTGAVRLTSGWGGGGGGGRRD